MGAESSVGCEAHQRLVLYFPRPLLKCGVVVKARLGQSVEQDMQELLEEGEQCCSSMWHQAALSADTVYQQLQFYHQAITSLRVLCLPHLSLMQICANVGRFVHVCSLQDVSTQEEGFRQDSSTIIWNHHAITLYFCQ